MDSSVSATLSLARGFFPPTWANVWPIYPSLRPVHPRSPLEHREASLASLLTAGREPSTHADSPQVVSSALAPQWIQSVQTSLRTYNAGAHSGQTTMGRYKDQMNVSFLLSLLSYHHTRYHRDVFHPATACRRDGTSLQRLRSSIPQHYQRTWIHHLQHCGWLLLAR